MRHEESEESIGGSPETGSKAESQWEEVVGLR